tara:strand:- start:848 stop:1858 length:1011 start_codon:yes stop_codon:yes gene_type:complete
MKDNRVYVIAEAGVNHNGDIECAIEMIKSAKKAGANCIKFQAFNLNNLLAQNALSADYQRSNTGLNSQWDVLDKLSFDKEAFKILNDICIEEDIEFLCTAFDEKWLKFLISLGMQRIKVPSGEITNYPYLRYVAKQNLPIILSTGMSNLKEIQNALNVIKKINQDIDISILHCTSLYPASMKTLNLSALETIKKEFNLKIGYSDHSLGGSAALTAIGLGARIIEKHFTLNKNFLGPDHKASLTSEELSSFIHNIRNIEIALGSHIKKPNKKELSTLIAARRSWHSVKNIKKGKKLSIKDVALLRPGNGILGDKDITGLKAIKNIKKGKMIEIEWLK